MKNVSKFFQKNIVNLVLFGVLSLQSRITIKTINGVQIQNKNTHNLFVRVRTLLLHRIYTIYTMIITLCYRDPT